MPAPTRLAGRRRRSFPLAAPQHLTSILAGLLAVVLLAMRHRWAPRVALTVAWIEIVAFLFFHGLPFEIGPSKPYWGDGMGDTLQWLGFRADLRVQRLSGQGRPPAGIGRNQATGGLRTPAVDLPSAAAVSQRARAVARSSRLTVHTATRTEMRSGARADEQP